MSTTAPPPTAVTLHALHAENFLVLGDVSIRFDGAGVDLLTGKNGNGKTSISWAVACLIDPSLSPDEPIKRGQQTATDRGDFGPLGGSVEFTVETKWWRNRNTQELEVKQTLTWPNGATQTSKVAEWVRKRLGLEKGDGRFDPFELARLGRDKPGRRKQADILRKIVGLDTADLDARRAALEAERKPINANAERLAALAGSVVVPEAPAPEAVGEEQTTKDLRERLKAAQAETMANAAKREEAKRARRAADVAAAESVGADGNVEDAIEALRVARDLAAVAKARAESVAEAAVAAELIAAVLVDPVTDEIDKAMDNLDKLNAEVRARRALVDKRDAAMREQERQRAAAEAEAVRAKAITGQIKLVEEEGLARIAAVSFPVPGLGVDGDEVTYNDGVHGSVPLAQASAAQQVRLWLAVRLAQHPTFRFIAVDSWSLLDDGMAEAAQKWAEENDVKILAEYVPHGDEKPAGLVVEAGAIVADRRPARAKASRVAPPTAVTDATQLALDEDL